jgi:adenylyltransferase/sulfurtransferase
VLFAALPWRFRELRLRTAPACPICGENPTIRELIDYEAFCGIGAAPAYQGPEVVVEQLKDELDQKGDELVLIDVREPHEWEIAHIDGARLIPLGQLPDRLGELDGHAEIVTYCHKGSRSMKALEILRGAGFGKVRSLAGGVDAWASRVETGMARY